MTRKLQTLRGNLSSLASDASPIRFDLGDSAGMASASTAVGMLENANSSDVSLLTASDPAPAEVEDLDAEFSFEKFLQETAENNVDFNHVSELPYGLFGDGTDDVDLYSATDLASEDAAGMDVDATQGAHLFAPSGVEPSPSKPEPQSFQDVNIDACVETALMSLPSFAPKPIWEEGVWSAIFGNGLLMESNFCSVEFHKPVASPFVDTWIEQLADCRRILKRSIPDSACESFADVVKHVTEQTWEEERESMLQSALKRWLMVLTAFKRSSLIWSQLAAEPEDVGKLTVLADVFRGKAPATLLKRVRAIEKICSYLGPDVFPCSESTMYLFFQEQRRDGAPPSRLKSYLEALAFCLYTFGLEELRPVVASKRLHGCTIPDVPTIAKQAAPLSVDELTTLHKLLQSETSWNSVFAGAVLFAVYSRARWADSMHSGQLFLDRDQDGITRYVEAAVTVHKTMHSNIYRHKMLPLVAPSLGIVSEPWADRWFAVRKQLNIELPPKHAVMPAPSSEGLPTQRPLSASEAGAWLRKILYGNKDQLEGKRVSAHSMKATMLSYAAKFGLDSETRLQLAYHVGGFKMVHTYSRDAAAQPLLQLERVLAEIRSGSFQPDSTRSGRFCKVAEPMDHSSRTAEVVDLIEAKPEVQSGCEEVPSSSSDESEEEAPIRNARVFKPPEPPPGYVFWQHKKMKTLHLAPPDYKRVFMCNRSIGPLHTKENMSIRYDTPVCRNCAAAVKG